MDNTIIFGSRDFKKAVSPCLQELRSPNFGTNRFRGTDSIKTILKNNDNVVINVFFRKGYVDEIWAAESAVDTSWVWTKLNDTDDAIMLR